jgi:hypothetical protein
MEAKETSLDCRSGGGKAQGEDTPFEPESSGQDEEKEDEDGEEGEVTPPPHSSLHEALPLFRDIFSRQAEIIVGAR